MLSESGIHVQGSRLPSRDSSLQVSIPQAANVLITHHPISTLELMQMHGDMDDNTRLLKQVARKSVNFRESRNIASSYPTALTSIGCWLIGAVDDHGWNTS